MPPSTGSLTTSAMTLFSEKKDDEIIAFLCNTSGKHPLQQAAVCEIFKRQSKEAQNYQVAWLKNLIITTPRQGNEKKIVLDTITDCQIDLAAVIKENFDPELQAIARMILAINAPVQERRELIAKLPLLLVAKNTHALPTVLLAASFYLPSLSESLFRRCMQLLDKQNPSVAYEAIKGLSVLAPLLPLERAAIAKKLLEEQLQNKQLKLLPDAVLDVEKTLRTMQLRVNIAAGAERLTIREEKLKCLDITRKNAPEQLPLVVANADETIAPEVTTALLALATTFGTEAILTLCPKNQFALMAQSFVEEIFVKAPTLPQAAIQVNGEESQEEPEQKPSEAMQKIMASIKIAANINLASTMPPNSSTPATASTSTAAHLKTHS